LAGFWRKGNLGLSIKTKIWLTLIDWINWRFNSSHQHTGVRKIRVFWTHQLTFDLSIMINFRCKQIQRYDPLSEYGTKKFWIDVSIIYLFFGSWIFLSLESNLLFGCPIHTFSEDLKTQRKGANYLFEKVCFSFHS